MASADILAFVLDGLADYLALERELGVRAIEVDRALLGAADRTHGTQTTQRTGKPTEKAEALSAATPKAEAAQAATPPPTEAKPMPAAAKSPPAAALPSRATAGPFDFIVIADKPLSPRAVEMMAKIIPAMGQTPETAPVVVSPPIPNARFFVFLGRAALAKYMPGLRGEENRWLKSPKGKDVLLVKSPEEIVRFTTVTPALKKMKQEMWLALKTVRQRAQLGM